MVRTKLHHLIDVRRCCHTLEHRENCLVNHWYQNSVANEARRVETRHRRLANVLAELDQFLNGCVASLQATNDFDKFHQRYGIEKMQSCEILLAFCWHHSRQ